MVVNNDIYFMENEMEITMDDDKKHDLKKCLEEINKNINLAKEYAQIINEVYENKKMIFNETDLMLFENMHDHSDSIIKLFYDFFEKKPNQIFFKFYI